MTGFLDIISDFTMGTGIWVYLFIFFGKIVEVTASTLRMILINRGVRTVGALIALVEIALWLVIASSVLSGFREDIWKGVAYAVAYAAGNYLGSWLDEWFAFGLSSLQVVISDPDKAREVSGIMRKKGFGVTLMDVYGAEEKHTMLMLTMKRKRTREAIAAIEAQYPEAVISVSDIKSQRGGYMSSRIRPGVVWKIGKR